MKNFIREARGEIYDLLDLYGPLLWIIFALALAAIAIGAANRLIPWLLMH